MRSATCLKGEVMKSQKDILKSIEGLSDIELFVIDLFVALVAYPKVWKQHDWMEINVQKLFVV